MRPATRSRPTRIARVASAAFIGIAALGAAPTNTRAQGSASHVRSPAAKQRLERGMRLFREQRYDEAVAEFRAGYDLEPNSDFLYALGQAERLRGNCAAAVDAYKSFLRTNPPQQEADLATGNMRRCDEHAEPAPTAAPSAAAPPPPAPSEGARASPSATPSEPPQASTARPAPTAIAVEARPAPARSPFYTDIAGDLLAGTGVVGLGVAAGFFFAANSDASAANSATAYDDLLSERASAERSRVVAAVSVGVGAALLVAGIVRYATRPHGAASGTAVRF